jgi:hypothetical protein
VKGGEGVGETGEERGDGAGEGLVLLDVIAGEADADLVLADPDQHLPELAARDGGEGDVGEDDDGEGEVVER